MSRGKFSNYSEGLREAQARFMALMCMRTSVIHFLELRTAHPLGFALTDWISKERFGSEKVTFPVMGLFGSKDPVVFSKGFDMVI